jgi:hypothetical protein
MLLRTYAFEVKNFLVDAFKLTPIFIGQAICRASWYIFIRALDKCAVYLAIALVLNGNSCALCHASVPVRRPVDSTNWLILLCATAIFLWRADSLEAELFIFRALKNTPICVRKSVSRTRGLVLSRARDRRTIQAALAFGGDFHLITPGAAFIWVSLPVNPADRSVLTRAYTRQRNVLFALALVFKLLLVLASHNAFVDVGLVVPAADWVFGRGAFLRTLEGRGAVAWRVVFVVTLDFFKEDRLNDWEHHRDEHQAYQLVLMYSCDHIVYKYLSERLYKVIERENYSKIKFEN